MENFNSHQSGQLCTKLQHCDLGIENQPVEHLDFVALYVCPCQSQAVLALLVQFASRDGARQNILGANQKCSLR